MNRLEKLRYCIQPGSRGIEIAPWHNPIAAKWDGFDTRVVDIFDQKTLVDKARECGFGKEKLERIESVDFVGDASNLFELLRGRGLTGQVDWVISSHNFEHLPDPLRFLQDCAQLLRPRGVLAMAIPDKRFCFDRFHPPSTTSGMIQATLQTAPPSRDAWARFTQQTLRAEIWRGDGTVSTSWSPESNVPGQLRVKDDVRTQFVLLQEYLQQSTDPAFSGHRWHYTPAVFQLIMLDLHVLGLLELNVERMWDTVGNEFVVQLSCAEPDNLPEEDYKAKRSKLLLQAEDESAVVSATYQNLQRELADRDAEIRRLKLEIETNNGRI